MLHESYFAYIYGLVKEVSNDILSRISTWRFNDNHQSNMLNGVNLILKYH